MPLLPDVHILNGKNVFWFGMYIRKVIINSLNISFTEGVSVSNLKQRADKVYIFEQDRGLAHYVRQRVELSLLQTRGRPTAQTLNQLITAFGNRCTNESTKRQYRT